MTNQQAADTLNELDPILGFDILFASSNKGQLTLIYEQCLERANVHPIGPLRNKWNRALDALNTLINTPA